MKAIIGLLFANISIESQQLDNEVPVYSKIYRFAEIHKKEVDKQINEMLETSIITKSNNPYNAPIWVVPKKKRKWRKFNNVTIEDKFPIPNMEDLFSKLGNSQYFSTIDLAKGFHQILISYEFTRMPFGLKNSPASLQRMMNDVLQDYINNICVVYLDDIIIFSTSIDEHILSLQKTFKRLSQYNLKVQVDKCNFFRHESEYLGHIITPQGIKPNQWRI